MVAIFTTSFDKLAPPIKVKVFFTPQLTLIKNYAFHCNLVAFKFLISLPVSEKIFKLQGECYT